MPIYKYKAITENGVVVTNTIEEKNKQSLIDRLKRNKLTPINIEATFQKKKMPITRKNIGSNINNVEGLDSANLASNKEKQNRTLFEKIYFGITKSEIITSRDIIVFTQNFYLLKKANFNNIHALNTIIQSTDNYSLKGILEDILAGVEAGEPIYATMEYYDNVFPYLYINMIKVGELSGNLTEALEQAVKYLEDTDSLNRKLRNILIPNIIQFVLLIIMLLIGTLVALPAIQKLYDTVGSSATLPPVSIWFSNVINTIITYWYIPTIIIIGVVAFIVWYVKTPKGKYKFDKFKYTMPIFGKLIFAIDFSRLIKAMLLNLNNGMRIQESLEVAKNVTRNSMFLSMVESSLNNIIVGDSWIEPFETSNLATPMMTEMLKIGMNTNLAEMMEKLTEYMEIDINNLLNKIIKILPQIVYGIVGIVLIFFVLVVLGPCIEVYMGGFLLSAYGLG